MKRRDNDAFLGFLFLGLGVSVMMLIVLTILGVLFGGGLWQEFRAGLTVGVGFIDLTLSSIHFGHYASPAVQEMIKRFGLALNVVDGIGSLPQQLQWGLPSE